MTGGTLVDDLDDPFDNAHVTGNVSNTRGHRPRAATYGGPLRHGHPTERSRPYSAYGAAEDNDFDSPFADSRAPSNNRPILESYRQASIASNSGVRAIALFDFNAVEVSVRLTSSRIP